MSLNIDILTESWDEVFCFRKKIKVECRLGERKTEIVLMMGSVFYFEAEGEENILETEQSGWLFRYYSESERDGTALNSWRRKTQK